MDKDARPVKEMFGRDTFDFQSIMNFNPALYSKNSTEYAAKPRVTNTNFCKIHLDFLLSQSGYNNELAFGNFVQLQGLSRGDIVNVRSMFNENPTMRKDDLSLSQCDSQVRGGTLGFWPGSCPSPPEDDGIPRAYKTHYLTVGNY